MILGARGQNLWERGTVPFCSGEERKIGTVPGGFVPTLLLRKLAAPQPAHCVISIFFIQILFEAGGVW